MLSQDTPAEVYWLLLYFDLQKFVTLLCFIRNHHKTFLISQISNQFLCNIFKDHFSLQTSKSTTLKKLQCPIRSKHLKMPT